MFQKHATEATVVGGLGGGSCRYIPLSQITYHRPHIKQNRKKLIPRQEDEVVFSLVQLILKTFHR